MDAKMNQKSIKKRTLGAPGSFFKDLLGFLESLMFDEFFDRQKLSTNLEITFFGRHLERACGILGRGRRQRRWPPRLLESEDF